MGREQDIGDMKVDYEKEGDQVNKQRFGELMGEENKENQLGTVRIKVSRTVCSEISKNENSLSWGLSSASVGTQAAVVTDYH